MFVVINKIGVLVDGWCDGGGYCVWIVVMFKWFVFNLCMISKGW